MLWGWRGRLLVLALGMTLYPASLCAYGGDGEQGETQRQGIIFEITEIAQVGETFEVTVRYDAGGDVFSHTGEAHEVARLDHIEVRAFFFDAGDERPAQIVEWVGSSTGFFPKQWTSDTTIGIALYWTRIGINDVDTQTRRRNRITMLGEGSPLAGSEKLVLDLSGIDGGGDSYDVLFMASIDYYMVLAVPLAFVVCMGVGMLLERTVIRFLYGRPLETLLATWGISLMLIQTVRLGFGAQNVSVANPSWLSGGYELLQGVVLPYNRIATIIFVGMVVAFVTWLLKRTPLGLQVRAITQNRAMASCMGINTSRIDMLTFGVGSGIAGLGGVALSQLGNVGPELGQLYIVDSFLVVVVGGVGKIAGSVVAALGLGTINKVLEPFAGAVLGKIFLLVFVVLFIQRRPQGLFALKGRSAES